MLVPLAVIFEPFADRFVLRGWDVKTCCNYGVNIRRTI